MAWAGTWVCERSLWDTLCSSFHLQNPAGLGPDPGMARVKAGSAWGDVEEPLSWSQKKGQGPELLLPCPPSLQGKAHALHKELQLQLTMVRGTSAASQAFKKPKEQEVGWGDERGKK